MNVFFSAHVPCYFDPCCIKAYSVLPVTSLQLLVASIMMLAVASKCALFPLTAPSHVQVSVHQHVLLALAFLRLFAIFHFVTGFHGWSRDEVLQELDRATSCILRYGQLVEKVSESAAQCAAGQS